MHQPALFGVITIFHLSVRRVQAKITLMLVAND
jgi:hypothetical protein